MSPDTLAQRHLNVFIHLFTATILYHSQDHLAVFKCYENKDNWDMEALIPALTKTKPSRASPG